MKIEPRQASFLLCFLLIIGELLVYSPSFDGFFSGDSIVQLDQRPRTIGETVETFTKVHNWYRPLTQRLCNYVLYPIFGLRFAPYHLIALALHIAASVLLYFALLRLIGLRLAAFVGASFFGIHSINFYTTYDGAFFAEPVLALAYIAGTWSFLSRKYLLAFLALAVGLVSKESAITMPLMFVVLGVSSGKSLWVDDRKELIYFSTATAGLLLVYGAIYVQWLHVIGWTIIPVQRDDYAISMNYVVENASNYAAWIFQVPRTWITESWVKSTGNIQLLASVGILVGSFAIVQLVRGDRKLRLALMWVAVTSVPGVAVARCFVHHAYMPLIGVSLMLACMFAAAQSRFKPLLFAVTVAAFLLNQADIAYRNVREDNRLSWVGRSAEISKQATIAIRGIGPMGTASHLFVVNHSNESLDFAFGGGALARLVTGDGTIKIQIVKDQDAIPAPLPPNSYILQFDDGMFHISEQHLGP